MTSIPRLPSFPVALAAVLAALASCGSVRFGPLERVGKDRSHLLEERVEEAREGQQRALEQFQTTLDALRQVERFAASDPDALLQRLTEEIRRTEKLAKDAVGHAKDIDAVAEDHFNDWRAEIYGIQNQALRQRGEAVLMDSREQYRRMIEALQRAESRVDPVLVAFADYALFLKHSLNAKAIASLEGSLAAIESDIESVIADMRAAVAEADAYLRSVRGTPPTGDPPAPEKGGAKVPEPEPEVAPR